MSEIKEVHPPMASTAVQSLSAKRTGAYIPTAQISTVAHRNSAPPPIKTPMPLPQQTTHTNTYHSQIAP